MAHVTEILRFTNKGAGFGQAPSGVTVACTNSISTTGEINYMGQSGGSVIVPTGSSITGMTFWGSDSLGTDAVYVPIFDNTLATPVAVAISGATAPGGVPIPDACFGYAGLKIVTNASGSVVVSLKG